MIVVTTPTGSIDSNVLKDLILSSGGAVRVIARDPRRLPSGIAENVEVIQGRTEDPLVMIKALEGASALFWCQPDTPTANDYLKAYEDWSRIGVEAIIRSQVPRVVAISGAGDKPLVPAGPASALHRMEEIFSESDASFRFLRCGSFFSNLFWDWDGITRDGVFSSGMPGHVPAPHLAIEDIARVAVGLLLDHQWQGSESLQLLGPQDISYDEMAVGLARKLRRPVRYEQLTEGAYKERSMRSGMSESAAQGLVDISNYLANHYKADPRVDRSITPTSFVNWLDKIDPAQLDSGSTG